MLLRYLDTTHPGYEASHWEMLEALYKGGKCFERHIDKFLPQNPQEPGDLYAQRKREAHYKSYEAPIIDYYSAFLFASGVNVKAKQSDGQSTEANEFYSKFRDDVGGDCSLADFMKERFVEMLVKQMSHWLIKFPRDASTAPSTELTKADIIKSDLGEARLVPVAREQLLDFERDEMGKLLWCVVHDMQTTRPSFEAGRDQVTETWTYYDRSKAKRWALTYPTNNRPSDNTDVPLESEWEHGCLEVPLMTMSVKEGLWLGERLRSAQVEHFRLSAGLSWSIKRCCYAMPILKLENPDKKPIMGVGYYLQLTEKDSFEWASPDSAPFDIIGRTIDSARDEIYRVAHQMAQGVDNNAETVGRSADSKEIDEAATRIMLNAYGKIVSKAIEEMFEVISDARGDTDVTFSVEGFSGYDIAASGALIANATNAQILGIPSKTFRREMKTKVAMSMIPEVDQETKSIIRDEIRDSIENMPEIAEDEFDAVHQVKAMATEERAKADAAKLKTAIELEKLKGANAVKVAKHAPSPNPDRGAGPAGNAGRAGRSSR